MKTTKLNKFKVVFPDGSMATRSSAHDYYFAVIAHNRNGWYICGYRVTRENAEALLRYQQKYFSGEISKVVPVTREG